MLKLNPSTVCMSHRPWEYIKCADNSCFFCLLVFERAQPPRLFLLCCFAADEVDFHFSKEKHRKAAPPVAVMMSSNLLSFSYRALLYDWCVCVRESSHVMVVYVYFTTSWGRCVLINPDKLCTITGMKFLFSLAPHRRALQNATHTRTHAHIHTRTYTHVNTHAQYKRKG